MRFSFLVLLLSVSCAASLPAGQLPPRHFPRFARLASEWHLPPGVSLATSCTKHPLELCFNAKDDNCDGLIDEGCGEETGPLQLVLAWPEKDVDLDLTVTGPDGISIGKRRRQSDTGLTFTRDCPAEDCGGQNVEVIFAAPEDEVPLGRYAVAVHFGESEPPLGHPVEATLGIRLGESIYELDLHEVPHGDIELSFDVVSPQG